MSLSLKALPTAPASSSMLEQSVLVSTTFDDSLARMMRWTVGRKLMTIVALCISFGYVILIAVQIDDLSKQSHTFALKKHVHLTKMIAAQIAGGVRWRKPGAIQRAYHSLTVDPESMLSAVIALDVQGQTLATYQSGQGVPSELYPTLELARAELDQGRLFSIEVADHVLIYAPITAGKAKTRVGTLGVAWSLELIRKSVTGELVRLATLSVAIVLGLIAILVYLLHRVVSRPLTAVTATTLRLAEGDTSVAVPFTDRKDEIGDMARSLKIFRENLKVIERLNAEQCAQTQRLAVALEKERDYNALQREFVAMASHEFRTPLAIIDGAAQRIDRKLSRMQPEEVREKTQKIRNAVKRMIALIESVLSSASLDAGKFKIQVQPCDLRRIVKDVCRRQQDISRTHEIQTDLADLPNEIVGDPRLLEQVFTNLLSNAVKYAPDNPEISVRGWLEGHNSFVAVKDRGLGIPAAEQPKVFDRYFRASTSSGIAGTGIGLNLSAQAIELHGGEVTFQSAEGEGSEFVVKLPVREFSKMQARHSAGADD